MSNSNPKIFIVDDDSFLSEMLTDYLMDQHPNFYISTFLTGEACLKNLHENPAIIILDYHLNSKEKDAANGIDILKEIKRRNKTVTVIMLSGQQSYGTAAQTIGYGAMHYVLKGQDAFGEIDNLIEANI